MSDLPVRFAGAALLLALLASCKPGPAAGPQGGGRAAGPIPVKVEPVARQDVPRDLRTFGTVEAPQQVEVRAQVSGLLRKVHFSEGQEVRAGDPLFSIDPRPMQAALQLAKANLARDQALQADSAREAARQAELLAKGLAYVMKEDQTVEARDLKLARSQDGLVVVAGGLAEGEQLVTGGQQRLFPGAKVSLPGAGPAAAAKP